MRVKLAKGENEQSTLVIKLILWKNTPLLSLDDIHEGSSFPHLKPD